MINFSRIGLLLLGLMAVTPLSLHGGPSGGTVRTPIPTARNEDLSGDISRRPGACFIALALGKQPHTITVTVYDAQDKVVGSDDGKRTAVIWYPPRDGEYRIEIRGSSTEERACYIAVK